MTRNWHRLMALVVALATSLGGALYAQEQSAQENAEEQKNEAQAQEEPQAEEKNEGAAAQDDSLQFDENLPPADESGDESDAASLEQELEKAVDADLGDAVKENSAEDLLNLATETKLGATTLLDLTKVISLCNKAEQRGLDEVNLEFAKQLRISAMLDRGLAIAQIFIDPDLQLDQLPRGWQGLRDHAITDLQTALDEYQDIPVAQMSLGRLFMLCDKPEDAKKAFDAAINSEEEDDGGPDVRTLALMFRAMLESDPRKALPYVDQGIDKYPEHEPRLYAMAAEYRKRDWAMQLHYGVRRDNNPVMFRAVGPDTGFDCAVDYTPAAQTAAFLGALEDAGNLPKTILYSLNPADNAVIGTIIGCFQNETAVGRIQHGSAWWFNDHFDGMCAQMKSLAALGYLAGFVGMLTDSRSFLSYPRHEYFRRILCRILGEWVEEGFYPEDMDTLKEIVKDISYRNAKTYFGFHS